VFLLRAVSVLQRRARLRHRWSERADPLLRAPRGGCAFCRESRLDRLAFRRTGEPPYGLEVCASCRHYLKSVDVPVSGYLAIERALSAPLDSGARAAGLVG